MSDGEIIDVVDENGKIVKSITRDEAERDNHITQNVLIFIFNSAVKVWLQLRPMSKIHYPGLWDISACGGVMSGESRDTAAERETKEETGTNPQLQYVESFLNVMPGDNGEERKRMSHLYIAVSDEKPETNEEVDEFRLWDPDELRKDAQNNPDKYVPTLIVELDKAVQGYRRLET